MGDQLRTSARAALTRAVRGRYDVSASASLVARRDHSRASTESFRRGVLERWSLAGAWMTEHLEALREEDAQRLGDRVATSEVSLPRSAELGRAPRRLDETVRATSHVDRSELPKQGAGSRRRRVGGVWVHLGASLQRGEDSNPDARAVSMQRDVSQQMVCSPRSRLQTGPDERLDPTWHRTAPRLQDMPSEFLQGRRSLVEHGAGKETDGAASRREEAAQSRALREWRRRGF